MEAEGYRDSSASKASAAQTWTSEFGSLALTYKDECSAYNTRSPSRELVGPWSSLAGQNSVTGSSMRDCFYL